jgi:DNA (cytosine-5)-methyltransferase 1
MNKTAIELFAGVGGFRVGLNSVKKFDKNGKAIENGPWKFVWANQWEPATKTQDAFDCYALRFGKDESSNADITKVKKTDIPNHTLLVGGFPCQDYSVARSLSHEMGIEGKKGVLWWEINAILIAKKPPFVLLENVDRLLKAPARQRGQAFGIMLRCFADAGYGVQWRVINAADYGHPQRRRRTFIFAFRKTTKYYKNFVASLKKEEHSTILEDGMMFSANFPSKITGLISSGSVMKDFPSVVEVSEQFAFPFENSGYSIAGEFYTGKLLATYKGKRTTLLNILDCEHVPASCYNVNVEKFRYLKGAKHILRTAKNGHQYYYSEGPIPFPDKLNEPGRTMLTSEGTLNRSSHFILDPVSGKYRVLTPVECERMDEFPDDWTNTGMGPKRRYFIAGNALVCGLIESMGKTISAIIDEENE